VQDLVRHLESGLGNEANDITFRLAVEPLPLPLELAIPCGMIVNELVSNAQKHAFPDGQAGEIRIEFVCQSDTYCLTVADDGVGIQSDGDLRQSGASLGLKVVQALTRQLHGDLQVQQLKGTRFVIHFRPELNGSV
jgi:two-component sensor histidine kinase